MKRTKLSPSKLSLLIECKRCFWLSVNKKINRPSGAFPSLPSGMDRVLKMHFDHFRGKNRLPPEIRDKLKGRLFDDEEKLKVWRNNFKGLQYVDEKSGIVLRGVLDDLFVTDDGKHVPLDFKTRGFPLKENTTEHYQHQMDVYCFLLDKNGIKTADFAFLVFYCPREVDTNGKFCFDVDVVKLETDKNNGKELFMRAIEILQGPEPEADDECPWCNWGSHNNLKGDAK